ncbi:MAG: putative tricarboxylic transport membrane protein [Parasphingorhabdus sp.]|jgi:putative tricarboxylic transport membrane protein
MRKAELVMALVMAVFSIYIMYKSYELPIGWIPKEGPGGGAFPFWLGAGMLITSLWTVLKCLRGTAQFSKVTDVPYMDRRTLTVFIQVAGSIIVMVGLSHSIGIYGSVPLFLFYYMKVLGRHSWTLCMSCAVLAPVLIFMFFEIALNITLPKGYTEPLFYPIYDLVY